MITLKNEAGITKTTKAGISWTVFFFGFFVPLFRGDWKWAAILTVANMIGNFIIPFAGGWAVNIIFMFKYNEWYINDLKEKGYKVV